MRRRGIVAGSVAIAVLGAAALRGVLRRFAIREASMAPALEPDDWIIARRRIGTVERGAVVIFDDPTGSGMHLVKRVIGLPGERIGIQGGRVTINGALLADRWADGMSRPDGTWDVPDDHVWLIGDNRAASASDSRVLGSIPLDDIQWVVEAIYYPPARAGRI